MRKRSTSASDATTTHVDAHHAAQTARSAVIAKFTPTAVVARSASSWQPTKRRGPGRPRIGQGAKRVLVTVERGLLAQADAYARRHHVTRSHLICDALRAIMTSDQKHRPHTPNAA